MSNLNKEIDIFSLGTMNNIIGLMQPMLMNEGLFSLSSQKEKLLNFRGSTTAIVMLEATVLDKIHTGPADHERSGDHTNSEEFHVLGETEDCGMQQLHLQIFRLAVGTDVIRSIQHTISSV